jgi:hypothetical protein
MSVFTILPLSSLIISKAKQRNKNGTGLSFSQQTTELGSKLGGFFFSCGISSFNSEIIPLEEDEVLRILFGGGSTVSTVSRVLRLLLGF